jgi:hypothetical protein
MTLVLSHIWETRSKITPKSVCTIHRIWEQQLTTAKYSVSVVDWATEDCFLEEQQTRDDLRKWQVPEVLFRSIPLPAKSASKKSVESSEEEAEYQIPNWVCLRYQKIHWTAWRCKVHGEAWKRAHKHTMNWMSGSVAVRYKREPICSCTPFDQLPHHFHLDPALLPCSSELT